MTPLPSKEITVTLPLLPSLFPNSMAETHFRTAVYWAVERRYPDANYVCQPCWRERGYPS